MYYDLLVNLYENDLNLINNSITIKDEKIKIKRILSPNSDNLVEFVATNFSKTWASEVKAAIYKPNPSCFIATYENEIVGFACFDATAKSYFGPTGIKEQFRGLNIGQKLLIHTLLKMIEDSYGYAVIGSVGTGVIPFYEKHLKLSKVPSTNSIYNRLLYK